MYLCLSSDITGELLEVWIHIDMNSLIKVEVNQATKTCIRRYSGHILNLRLLHYLFYLFYVAPLYVHEDQVLHVWQQTIKLSWNKRSRVWIHTEMDLLFEWIQTRIWWIQRNWCVSIGQQQNRGSTVCRRCSCFYPSLGNICFSKGSSHQWNITSASMSWCFRRVHRDGNVLFTFQGHVTRHGVMWPGVSSKVSLTGPDVTTMMGCGQNRLYIHTVVISVSYLFSKNLSCCGRGTCWEVQTSEMFHLVPSPTLRDSELQRQHELLNRCQ